MRSAVVALMLALALAPARAEPAQEREALDHLDRGIAAYRLGDYAQADRELEDAHRLAPDRANPYRWLALVADKLGDCPRVVENAEAFMSRVPAGDPRVPEIVALRDQCVHAARGPVQPAPPLAPPPPSHDGVVHRWWFWTAVGAVVLAGGGVATYYATRSTTAMLPGVHCTPSGCAP